MAGGFNYYSNFLGDTQAAVKTVNSHFAYGSFSLLSVRLRIMSVRLRPICQFAYDSYVSFKTELFKSPC